nr:hypothetical protein [Tanacetum cinerariifolium]
MENEHELSYETLTRVYLRSYEYYKSVGAGVELVEPWFELDDHEWVEMGSFLFDLLGSSLSKVLLLLRVIKEESDVEVVCGGGGCDILRDQGKRCGHFKDQEMGCGVCNQISGDGDTMADVNINAPADQAPTMAPPTRTCDQILPHIRWGPIGKSNCYLDFKKAFTASSTIPSIYIQQFWDTVRYDKTAGCYKCQLDEQWFDLTKETLRDALQITPVNNNKAFSSPLSSDALINFVNELGYLKLVTSLSNVIIWGVVNRAHLDYAEWIWEEFTQSIHTFIEDKKNLAQHTHGKKKATLIVILSIKFTKLIIYHLQRKHKFHPRPDSPFHLPNEEHVLGYLNDPDSLAPKPTKATKKSKPSAPKASLRPSVTKPASSQQPEPKPAPAKPGLVSKRRKAISSLRSIDESVAKGIPEKEPRVDDEEADVQRALEESLKSIYNAPRGPLGNQSLENINRFLRRTSTPTGSSGHDESSSLYVEIGLTDNEVESNEDVPGIDAGVPDEGQAGPNPGDQDEGQAGPNPNEQDEGQARPNPNDAAASQPLPSPVVYAGLNLEHMDLEVQENLKLTVKEQVILEEPASSTWTFSPLQHLTKDLSFGELFFNDKPSKADNEKTTAETKAESMVSVIIQQDTSSIPPMKTPRIGELEHIKTNLIQDNNHLEERLDSHGARLYKLENLDIPQQVSKAVYEIVIDAIDWAIQAPLRNRFRDLPEANMKKILHQRMWETNSYQTHKDQMMLYEALEKSMNRDNSKELLKDLAEARKKKKKRHDSPKMPPGSPPHQPPPPSPPIGPSGAAILSGAKNYPPMLEKDMYDSWRSGMELYMLNRQHGRMILESVEHGPLLWPSVTEDGVTRLKKYSELSSAEATQADCDVKATNIILQALPP